MKERERGSARGRERERESIQNVKEREWGSVRVGRPRERVRTQRERKGEKREDHGWRTLSTRRTSRWNDGVRVRHQRASSSRHMSEDKAQTGYTKWNSNNGGHNQYRRTVERWNTRKEELIDDITNHGDWVEVSRKRKTKMAASRGRMERNSCQGKEKKMTWRNKDDVTTFYFSRFPEGIMEQDMWQIFQKWGKVWEVFIPRTKNKLGHRFGFVRFKEVVDVQSLERRLDNNIFIGGQKLFVNRPKFDRGKVFCTQETGTVTRGMGDAQQVYKGAQMDKRTSVKEGRPRSYAEVVKEFEPGQTSSLNLVEADSFDQRSHRGPRRRLHRRTHRRRWPQECRHPLLQGCLAGSRMEKGGTTGCFD